MIDFLRTCHPQPPVQGPVGNSPSRYAQELGGPYPQQWWEYAQSIGQQPNTPIDRETVRRIGRDSTLDPRLLYAVIMAWGGQRMDHFRSSIAAEGLFRIVEDLRESDRSRSEDFQRVQAQAEGIPGLGLAFYTKLLWFLRPAPNAFILDQWTAKGVLFLGMGNTVRLRPYNATNGYAAPDSATTGQEYEAFCQRMEDLPAQLWGDAVVCDPSAGETAVFDAPRGRWRSFVSAHFKNRCAGRLLVQGGTPVTTEEDFQRGVLRVEANGLVHSF